MIENKIIHETINNVEFIADANAVIMVSREGLQGKLYFINGIQQQILFKSEKDAVLYMETIENLFSNRHNWTKQQQIIVRESIKLQRQAQRGSSPL